MKFLIVFALQAEGPGVYIHEIVVLKGMRILFKVEKSSTTSSIFDSLFRVKRLCKNQHVIERFLLDGLDYTPTKVWNNA